MKPNPPPLTVRQVIAAITSDMDLKWLSLRWVANKAGVRYSLASEVINGRRIHPEALEKIRSVIAKAPTPK